MDSRPTHAWEEDPVFQQAHAFYAKRGHLDAQKRLKAKLKSYTEEE